jgi:hypothetical protein
MGHVLCWLFCWSQQTNLLVYPEIRQFGPHSLIQTLVNPNLKGTNMYLYRNFT